MELSRPILPYPALSLAGIVAVIALLTVTWVKRRRQQSKPKSTGYGAGDAPELDRKTTVNAFPPSRRQTLETLLPSSKRVRSADILVEELRAKQLPSTRVQDLYQDDQYTPTGFSTQEIRALGRFPDYSVLSGVPKPQPAPSFDITKAVFRPFRPFRWNYHQTMALMKFETDWWVELEQNYFRRMKQRLDLYKEYGDKVMFWCPGSELATRELMEMVLQWVSIRYPHYFQLEKDNTIFRNRLLDTVTDLTAMHPLQALFNNIPEDYAIMCRNENDGMYYLRAAMVCSSVAWNIGLHKNKILRRIHDNVPQWEKMAFSVDRWFTKLPVDTPAQRCSWGIEDWEAFFAPEDMPRSAFEKNTEACKVEDLQLRCDWQTLRRLPLSGSIIFNFKAVFTKFTDLASEPYVPALLKKVVTEGRKDLIRYKMEEHVEKLVLENLDKWTRKQVADGAVPKDWEVGTLEQHPYFPDWKDKWDCPACPCI